MQIVCGRECDRGKGWRSAVLSVRVDGLSHYQMGVGGWGALGVPLPDLLPASQEDCRKRQPMLRKISALESIKWMLSCEWIHWEDVVRQAEDAGVLRSKAAQDLLEQHLDTPLVEQCEKALSYMIVDSTVQYQQSACCAFFYILHCLVRHKTYRSKFPWVHANPGIVKNIDVDSSFSTITNTTSAPTQPPAPSKEPSKKRLELHSIGTPMFWGAGPRPAAAEGAASRAAGTIWHMSRPALRSGVVNERRPDTKSKSEFPTLT